MALSEIRENICGCFSTIVHLLCRAHGVTLPIGIKAVLNVDHFQFGMINRCQAETSSYLYRKSWATSGVSFVIKKSLRLYIEIQGARAPRVM